MPEFEKKWWYTMIVSGLTSCATMLLMYAVGFPNPSAYSPAQWLVFGLSMAAIWRCISGLVWLITLLVSPQTIALPRQTSDQP